MIHVFYRGPLERSRLGFLLDLFLSIGREVRFYWLLPHPKFNNSENQVIEPFMSSYPGLKYEVIPAPLSVIFRVKKQLKKIISGDPDEVVVSIGFTAPFFLSLVRLERHIWCINGIPEESLLHKNTWLKRLEVSLKWKLMGKFYRPKLILTVSKRMSAHVSGFFPGVRTYSIPLCVDLERFKKDWGNKKTFYTYCGSGAPWQNLTFLSLVWAELFRLDPTLKFRVISRESRTKILSQGLPVEAIEFVGTSDLDELATYLSETEVGFLIRKDTLVNRVSFPTKLLEYLASGSWVVTSDIDWDVADIISEHKVGLLVNPNSCPRQVASLIIRRRGQFNNRVELYQNISNSLIQLEKDFWIEEGKKELQEFLGMNTQKEPLTGNVK